RRRPPPARRMDPSRVGLGGRLVAGLRRASLAARSRARPQDAVVGRRRARDRARRNGRAARAGHARVASLGAPRRGGPAGAQNMLTSVERVLILKGADLLREVGPRHLLRLAEVAIEVELSAGDTI